MTLFLFNSGVWFTGQEWDRSLQINTQDLISLYDHTAFRKDSMNKRVYDLFLIFSIYGIDFLPHKIM